MAWKPTTQFYTLPSGQRPRIRKIDVISLITEGGNVPDTLIGKLMSGTDVSQLKGEEATAFIKVLNQACRASFVEPRIVEEPDYSKEGAEISIYDIELRDKVALFQYLSGGSQVDSLAQFPDEQNANGKSALPRQIIRETALRDDED